MKLNKFQAWEDEEYYVKAHHIQLSTITQWTANLNNVQWENVSYVLKNRFLNDSRILVRNSEISVSRGSGSVDKRICLQCKRFLAMQETWVRALGQEDPLKKEMAIHSSIFACDISWTQVPGRLQSLNHKS